MLKWLEPGFHIALADSKITQMDDGIFISWDVLRNETAIELKDYLEKHFKITPDDFPYLYREHVPAKIALERFKEAYKANQEKMMRYYLEQAGLTEDLKE